MVTASVQPHHRAQAEQAAVDGFVAKPFEPDELLALIGVLAVGRPGLGRQARDRRAPRRDASGALLRRP